MKYKEIDNVVYIFDDNNEYINGFIDIDGNSTLIKDGTKFSGLSSGDFENDLKIKFNNNKTLSNPDMFIYKHGLKYTGFIEYRNPTIVFCDSYKKGLNGKYVVDGKLYTGMIENMKYINGKPQNTYIIDDMLYIHGELATGEYNNRYYIDGIEQYIVRYYIDDVTGDTIEDFISLRTIDPLSTDITYYYKNTPYTGLVNNIKFENGKMFSGYSDMFYYIYGRQISNYKDDKYLKYYNHFMLNSDDEEYKSLIADKLFIYGNPADAVYKKNDITNKYNIKKTPIEGCDIYTDGKKVDTRNSLIYDAVDNKFKCGSYINHELRGYRPLHIHSPNNKTSPDMQNEYTSEIPGYLIGYAESGLFYKSPISNNKRVLFDGKIIDGRLCGKLIIDSKKYYLIHSESVGIIEYLYKTYIKGECK